MFWKRKGQNTDSLVELIEEQPVEIVSLTRDIIEHTIQSWPVGPQETKMNETGNSGEQDGGSPQYSLKDIYGDNKIGVIEASKFMGNETVWKTVSNVRVAFGRPGEPRRDGYGFLLKPFTFVELSFFKHNVCRNILKDVVEDHAGEDISPTALIDDALEWCQYAGVLAAITFNINKDFSKYKDPYHSLTRDKGLDEIIRLIEIKTRETDKRFQYYETYFPVIRKEILNPLVNSTATTEEQLEAQIRQCLIAAYESSVQMEIIYEQP